MSIVGEPTNWADLIDPLVPDILGLVIATWEGMAAPHGCAGGSDIREFVQVASATRSTDKRIKRC